MLTRQHFEIVAKILRDNATLTNRVVEGGQTVECDRLVSAFADHFKKVNPNFKHERFYDAVYEGGDYE
jgi:hypothetical protein